MWDFLCLIYRELTIISSPGTRVPDMSCNLASVEESHYAGKGRLRTLILFLLATSATLAVGQGAPESNQLGLLLGAEFIGNHSTATIPSTSINFSNSVVFQLNFAHRLKGSGTQLWLEFPSAAAPSHTVTSINPTTPISLATFYTTPSFRLNFHGQRTLSPWVSFGGGYALYEGSERLRNGAENLARYTNTGTLQFGAGVDVRTKLRIWKPIGFRGEIRDFYSFDTLNFATPVRDHHQHNVVVSGGFIVRF
jgi:hypothetical protein